MFEKRLTKAKRYVKISLLTLNESESAELWFGSSRLKIE